METQVQNQAVVGTLRAQFAAAHGWVEGTMHGVTAELAHSHPGGRAHPIGAEYVHVAMSEDFFVNSLLRGAAPLMASSHSGKTGASTLPPMGDWSEWGRSVQVDLEAARAYAQAVYAATDEYLASLGDTDLGRSLDLNHIGLGTQTVGYVFSLLILNAAAHAGEISAMKGIQGLQGYPF